MDHLANKVIPQLNLPKSEIIKLLFERFLHLAQNILCDRKAALQVSNKAIESVQSQSGEWSLDENMIQWATDFLDKEIECYFQELIGMIKSGSAESENMLCNILYKRFMMITCKKVALDNILRPEDADDIVQNALLTVAKKCRTAKPKGTFIQWAQTILKYKYGEYRRKKNKQAAQTERPVDGE